MNAGMPFAPKRNGMESAVPPKKFRMAILLRLGKYLFHNPLPILFAIILLLLSNVLALVAPELSGKAIDAIGLGDTPVDFRSVFYYAIMMIVCYAASALLSWVLSVTMIRISRSVSNRMRGELFEHLLSLPVSFFDTHPVGELISRFSYDVDTINASLANDLIQICGSIVTVIGALVMMLIIEPILVLVFAITLPVSLYFTRYKSIHVRPLFRKRSEKLGEMNGYVEEMLSGLPTLRAYHREDTVVDHFAERNDSAVEAYYQADYHACVIGPSVNFINNLSLGLISMFGAILYLLGHMTPGNISTFILYSRKFAGPINEAANIISEIQSALSATERVFAILDENSEIADAPDAVPADQSAGMVDFKHLTFGYLPDQPVLKDVDFHVESGQTIAIVGPTGAGKTTIINLLMRFYELSEGQICLNETPIDKIIRTSHRSCFTMVLQDSWLFCGTIFENIAYGKEGTTEEEVYAAAKAAHIHDFILSLPEGYQTVISDNGSNLSKGQKQLLTIARAMVSNAPILILDEATSNVDSRTEQQIQQAMLELMKGRTSFVIAHRLSTVQNADRILVVRNNRIEEQGTHEELLSSGGYYSLLFRSQFE